MVSVIIPLYNKQEYIYKTLSSVLAQDFTEFEVIVVNDGSTDESEKIIHSFEDDRITLITLPNSGVSIARNAGITAANFDWIALLDADDWWAPSFLSEWANAFEAYPDESVFASGRTRVFQDHSKRYVNPLLPKAESMGLINYFEVIAQDLPPINSSNGVLRKSVLSHAGYFNPNMQQHEDHDLWLRLAVNHSIVFFNKPLSFYNKDTQDSQSQHVLAPHNFRMYLETMLTVRDKISPKESRNLDTFMQRYGALTFIKYSRQYASSDSHEIYSLLQRFMKGKELFMVRLAHRFPFINWYKILRFLR